MYDEYHLANLSEYQQAKLASMDPLQKARFAQITPAEKQAVMDGQTGAVRKSRRVPPPLMVSYKYIAKEVGREIALADLEYDPRPDDAANRSRNVQRVRNRIQGMLLRGSLTARMQTMSGKTVSVLRETFEDDRIFENMERGEQFTALVLDDGIHETELEATTTLEEIDVEAPTVEAAPYGVLMQERGTAWEDYKPREVIGMVRFNELEFQQARAAEPYEFEADLMEEPPKRCETEIDACATDANPRGRQTEYLPYVYELSRTYAVSSQKDMSRIVDAVSLGAVTRERLKREKRESLIPKTSNTCRKLERQVLASHNAAERAEG